MNLGRVALRKSSERHAAGQAINAAEQELHLPVSAAWLVLGNHVSREGLADPGQLALGVSLAHEALGGQAGLAHVGVVWNVEVVSWGRLETLHATEGHVLDGHESSVHEQDEVELAVGNDGPVQVVNETWDNFPAGLWGSIIDENVVGTF